MASYAANAPTISKEGVALDLVDAGGAMGDEATVFVEDDDVFVDSGDQGILGREVDLVSVTARATMRCGSS